ncbi:39S ribosomal protein L46, mitochondrial-like isoform X2 [Mya arenaria]|uniref:39S ribosomal protein L46, mitochondrial-like isoform X2 n=1 Tax=Mya arenaria TaxID=6604 RepID=UPI0022E1DBC2|nr:39S ribosomal protein L46, mitochondrial-like isoform X2 [Mya arenaria]
MAAPIRISKILLGLIKASPQCRIGRRYASAAPQESRTWQLHSAVCLQRYPRLTAPMNDIEQRFQEHLNKVEYRRSLRSNYELDLTKEKELFEKMKIMTEDEKKKLIAEQDLLTMKEQEEDWQKEFEEFKLTDRLTEADMAGNEQSANRLLEKKLVLIVKKQWEDGGEPQWMFPQSARLPGESMRQAAERSLVSTCGEELDAIFLGNAPCGYHKYKMPARYQGPEYGVKEKSILMKGYPCFSSRNSPHSHL